MELPSEAVQKAIVQRYADLVGRLGDEIGQRPLVLPNGDFFPDAFTADEPSIQRLVRRMQAHAGLTDVPIVTRVIGLADAPQASNCSSGACAPNLADTTHLPRVVDDGKQWTLQVPASELQAPVVLTTMTARSLGRIFLVETADERGIAEPVDVSADLASVALGFGPLMLEGAYMYSKSCGGPHVGRATHLGLPELAIATALFMSIGGHTPRKVLKELSTTQRAVLDEATAWAASNRALVAQVSANPTSVAQGNFVLQDAKPWLLRILGRKGASKSELPDELDIAELEALGASLQHTKTRREPDPETDELSKLVSEALTESRADAE